MTVTFSNSFDSIAFGWTFGGPTLKAEGGVVDTWSGEITLETLADFESLWAIQCPTNVRVIARAVAFVDFWDVGASPIFSLVQKTAVAAGTVTTTTRLAILDHIERATLNTDGSVRASALFVATDLPAP